jgi:hypothetical protein
MKLYLHFCVFLTLDVEYLVHNHLQDIYANMNCGRGHREIFRITGSKLDVRNVLQKLVINVDIDL